MLARTMELVINSSKTHYSWVNNDKTYLITCSSAECHKCFEEICDKYPENPREETWSYVDGEYKCISCPIYPDAGICIQYGWGSKQNKPGTCKNVCPKHFESVKGQFCNIHNKFAKIDNVPKICKSCVMELLENTEKLFKICKYPVIRECDCEFCLRR